jgi:hypothetical protein
MSPLGKGYFWGEKHEGKKGQLEGKATRAREACEAHMQGRPNTLGLGFLQYIVMDDEPRIYISST